MKESIVVKIGGSLLFNEEGKVDKEKISGFVKIFKISKNKGSLVIVCGGGSLAREYIKIVRSFNGSEALCDIFGIEISRINSRLIIAALRELAYPLVPKSIEELATALLFEKIVVMGGLQPGQSTTSVALEIAEYLNTKELVILTDVKGIYNKDPQKFADAKLLEKLNYNELQSIILNTSKDNQAAAGEYRIFDAVSLQILKRSKLKVKVMSGKDLNEFRKFWDGNNETIGTDITIG